jgi:hypothetical protein
MNRRVEFLTDGSDTVRELRLFLAPESEHWLDWFPVAMRLTVMGQMARGLALEQGPRHRWATRRRSRFDWTCPPCRNNWRS